MAQTKRLTRLQISDFIQTERGVRAFEDVQSDILSADSGITNATFLTLGSEPSLGSERVFGPVSGELTATDGGANGVYAVGLADTGVVAGTYGSSTKYPVVTVDAKGRLTAVTLQTAPGGGGGVSDGDKGDITVSGVGTVWTIDAQTITNAKLSNVSTATFKGRVTAGAGSPEDLTGTQATTLLDTFTSALKGLAPASGGGTTNFLRADGSWAAPGGGGGGTTLTSGATTVNFGAFPGASDASVTITGQTGILAGSKVKAYIIATATSDHSADEHWLETIDVKAGNIVAGTGFTIYAKNTNQLSEPVAGQWASTRLAGPGTGANQIRPDTGGGKGTRLYGEFTVAWEWY